MNTVTIHDAKTNLSKYITKAKQGHTIYIGSFGKPEVMLQKIPPTQTNNKQARDFSPAKGKITLTKEAFTPETDAQIADLITGSSDQA